MMAGGNKLKHILPLSEVRCNGSRNSMQGALTLCHVSLQNCLHALFYVCSGRIEMARLKVHVSCTGMALCMIFILSGWPRSCEGFCAGPPSTLLEWAQSLWHAVAALEVPPMAPTCFVERFESVVSRLEFGAHFTAQDWCLCYIGLRNVENKTFWTHDKYGRMPSLTWMSSLPQDKRNIMKLTILNNTAANLQAAKARGPAFGSGQLSAMLMVPTSTMQATHANGTNYNFFGHCATTPSRASGQCVALMDDLSSGRRRARDAPLRAAVQRVDDLHASTNSMNPPMSRQGVVLPLEDGALDPVMEEEEMGYDDHGDSDKSEDLETLRNLQIEVTNRFLAKQQKYNRGIRAQKKRSTVGISRPFDMGHRTHGIATGSGIRPPVLEGAIPVTPSGFTIDQGRMRAKNSAFNTPAVKKSSLFTPGPAGQNSMNGFATPAGNPKSSAIGFNPPTIRENFAAYDEADSEIEGENDLVGSAPMGSQQMPMLKKQKAERGLEEFRLKELGEDLDMQGSQRDITNAGATLGKAAAPTFNRDPRFKPSLSSVADKLCIPKKVGKISKKGAVDAAEADGAGSAKEKKFRKSRAAKATLKSDATAESGGRSAGFIMSPIVPADAKMAQADTNIIAEASALANQQLEKKTEARESEEEPEDDLLADTPRLRKIRRLEG